MCSGTVEHHPEIAFYTYKWKTSGNCSTRSSYKMYLSSFASFCRCHRDLKARRENWRTRLHRQQAHLTNFDPLMRLEASQMAAAFCALCLVWSVARVPRILSSLLRLCYCTVYAEARPPHTAVSHPCASLGSRSGDKKLS